MGNSGLMLLGVGGAAIGASIYFFGTPYFFGPQQTPQGQAFILSPEFVTWFFINEVLFAFYPILPVLLWKPRNQLGKHFLNNKLEIFASSFILFALYIFPLLIGVKIVNFKPLPLAYADTKIRIIETIGFLLSALPLAIGIWLVHAAIRDTFGEIKPSEKDVKEYICFRDYLQQFLMILGALLSLFILASAALRKAAIAFGTTTTNDYPSIYLLILGAYYTLLIALIYFPAYIALVSAGRRLLDACFALPAPDSQSWAETYAKRKELEDVLELKVTGEQRFLTSITLLAPFVSSIFSLLIETQHCQ